MRDVLSVLQRRLPAVPVLIYPVVVQGEEAPRSILNALRLAEQRQDCDLLILTRGGGSLEDLMAFNDEAVARAIHALTIPLISAVGHEVDFTIADFVADRRAPTPSVAAELATPDKQEILDRLNSLQRRISLGTLRHLASNRQTLQALGKRLERMHPDMRLQQRQQYLDELAMRLLRSIRSQMEQGKGRTGLLTSRLHAVIPIHRINQQRELFNGLKRRLLLAVDSRLRIKRQGLGLAIGKLDTLSPLATLHRGYSITRLLPERNVLRDTSQAKTGDKLETRVSNGSVISTVETTVPL